MLDPVRPWGDHERLGDHPNGFVFVEETGSGRCKLEVGDVYGMMRNQLKASGFKFMAATSGSAKRGQNWIPVILKR